MSLHFIQTKKVLYYFTVAIILVATVFVCGVLTTASVKAESGNGQYLLAQNSPLQEFDKAAGVANLKRSGSLGTQVGTVIKGVLGLVEVLLLLMLIYGGFTWMTAGGNSEKVQQANKIINNAIIGLIIIFLSYAMTNFWITQIKNAATDTGSNTPTGACVYNTNHCQYNVTYDTCNSLYGTFTPNLACSQVCPSCIIP